jgi:hypothetical protein
MSVIAPVQTPRDFKELIRVPGLLHAQSPHFIARLDLEMTDHLGPKNPYFQHAEAQYFLARDAQGKPTGRISAQIDTLAQKKNTPRLGHFGLIEADTPATLQSLLHTAEDWLKAKDAHAVHGPYSLSINDETGLLVDGFDSAPRMMMNYAPPWYGPEIERAGYTKAKDTIAYTMQVRETLPGVAKHMAKLAAEDTKISERALDMKNFTADLNMILAVFNNAWADNWGFIPMTPEEITYTAKSMRPVIIPELARIAFVDGKPAAMIVGLPDINEAVADLNGRLLPIGWAKLLWRLKIKGLKGGRVLLMGVRKEFQNGAMGGALASLLIERLQSAAANAGFETLELSWILEDNLAMNRMLLAFGAKPYKTYRVYQKDLQ